MKNLNPTLRRSGIILDCMNRKTTGMTIKEIADKYNVSVPTVMKWKDRTTPVIQKRKRKKKLNRKVRKFIYTNTADKFTGVDKASSRKIANRVQGKFGLTVSHSTIAKCCKEMLRKPIKAGKAFLLTKKNQERRVEFAKYVLDIPLDPNSTRPIRQPEFMITGVQIGFSDEKFFELDTATNGKTNQIRLTNETWKKLKAGDEEIHNKIYKQAPKFDQKFMVAACLTPRGPGKLIFIVGTVDGKCYQRILNFFKEDFERLYPSGGLYFQQDNARCHVSKVNMQFIRDNFEKTLDFWPPNSPDLSAIEDLWAIVQNKLQEKEYKTLEEQKIALVEVWNRIPVSLCRKLCKTFDKRVEQVLESNGRRFNRMQYKQIDSSKKVPLKWSRIWNSNPVDEIERVVYSDITLEEVKKKVWRAMRRKINKIKGEFKATRRLYTANFIKCLKMSISQGRAYEKKGIDLIEAHNARIRLLNEELERFDAMSLEDYYQTLNPEQVKKLINSMPVKLIEDDDTQLTGPDGSDGYSEDESEIEDSSEEVEDVNENEINIRN